MRNFIRLKTVLLLFAVFCHPVWSAQAWEVVKTRPDPMIVEYSGIDLNGDRYPDTVTLNLFTGKRELFLGRMEGDLERVNLDKLSKEDRSFLPDLVTEVDLDGDRINELVVLNLEKFKARTDNEAIVKRMIENSVFIGGPGGTFRCLNSYIMTEEQKAAIMDTAKKVLLSY